MKIWFIDEDAQGANNGTSWANAFTSRKTAVAAGALPETPLPDCDSGNMKGKPE